jgi:SAM-dependent methyltransferase
MTPALDPDAKWYLSAFNKTYLSIYPHRNDESALSDTKALIASLDLSGSELVLDACCGDGRHLRALKTLGFKGFGFDLSSELLLASRRKIPDLTCLIRADSLAIPFPARFQIALSMFSSFGYFLEDDFNAQVLKQLHACLEPGGRIVIDHINKTLLKRTLVPYSEDHRDQLLIRQTRKIESNRVIKLVEVERAGYAPCSYTETVRLYDPEEIRNLLITCGFNHICIWGGFDGSSFQDISARMITVGVKQ